MKKIIGLILVVGVLFCSCEEGFFELENPGDLTTDEVVEGLKKALEIGTDSATSSLSLVNGYYLGDVVNVKIPLPDEAETIRGIITSNSTINNLFNLDSKFEDVVRAVNRAAEKAAKDAGGIFLDAITDMSITDAFDILNGYNPLSSSLDPVPTAATDYFKDVTTSELTNLFAPSINSALGEDLGLGFSATSAWSTLTSAYNSVRNNAISATTIRILGYDDDLPSNINDDLGAFCTGKALDGLFFMVSKEEEKIRENPYKWAVNIIQKVFGSLLDNDDESV